jgi:hypothetical protein
LAAHSSQTSGDLHDTQLETQLVHGKKVEVPESQAPSARVVAASQLEAKHGSHASYTPSPQVSRR